MSRIRWTVPILLVVAAAVPASSAERARALTDLPPQWQPQTSAAERLETARDTWMDREAFESLRADLLREHATAALIADPMFVYPSRAGDLTGDGRNDVLTTEFSEGVGGSLVARSGLDGSVLWEAPDTFFGLPVDLDGDGVRDVLTMAQTSEATGPGTTTLEHTIDLRAADGSTIWTHTVPGVVFRNADPKGGQAADLEYVTGLDAMPDATGDGVDDVWVQTQSFAYLDSEVFVVATATAARVLDGATGAIAGLVATADLNGLTWAIPSGDVSGDGLGDLFVLTGLGDGSGLLSARSSLGVPHWIAQVPTSAAYPSVHDFTGDGIPDLMMQAFTPDGGRRLAYSGADGSLMWDKADIGYTDAAGDIDGDGAIDIIQVESPSTGIVARAWSGATGDAIWGPVEYPAAEGAWVLNCVCNDDLTGDGRWDPMTAEVVFADPITVTIRTLDGSSGLPLWVASANPSESFPVPIGADVTGDGAADLGSLSSDGATITARAIRGTDFTPAGSRSLAYDGFGMYFYADDVAGDADHEFVLATLRFVDESLRGGAHALGQGGLVWSIP